VPSESDVTQSLRAVAATLACPAGMGLMMWIMMRGHGRTHQTINPGSQQIEELRAEIERRKAERATDTGSGSGPVTVAMPGRGKPRIVTACGG
jgi:hypothetical protein